MMESRLGCVVLDGGAEEDGGDGEEDGDRHVGGRLAEGLQLREGQETSGAIHDEKHDQRQASAA